MMMLIDNSVITTLKTVVTGTLSRALLEGGRAAVAMSYWRTVRRSCLQQQHMEVEP